VASTVLNSATYGVGVYGSAKYGRIEIVVFNLDAATATGSIGSLAVNITTGISGVSATGAISPVVAGGFEIDISEVISTGVSATGSVGTFQLNVDEKLSGLSATATIGTPQPIVSFSVDVVGVGAVAFLGNIEAKTTEVVDIGVSATGAVGTLTLHTTAGITGVQGTFAVGTGTYTGVQFDFNAVRELYDRRRTSVIDRAA
jgi:hypothetical protein